MGLFEYIFVIFFDCEWFSNDWVLYCDEFWFVVEFGKIFWWDKLFKWRNLGSGVVC